MVIEAWPPVALELAYAVDPSASSYFVAELEEAYNYGLTYPAIMINFGLRITREEFCTIVVKLYERLSGKTALAGPSPFTDTANAEIIKAAQLEIVMGVGGGLFMPARNITRQEICVMILRCLRKSLATVHDSATGGFPFADAGLIASWAFDAMRFCYRNEIMKGVSATTIDPLNNTTREQAIVLLKRTYVKYRPEIASNPPEEEPPGGGQSPPGEQPPATPKLPPGAPEIIEGTVLLSEPSRPVSELDKFVAGDWDTNLAQPRYDTRLDLYTATEPGKPPAKPASAFELAGAETASGSREAGVLAVHTLAALNADATAPLGAEDGEARQTALTLTPTVPLKPALPWSMPRPEGPVYSRSPYALVDKAGDEIRWFAFTLAAPNVAKVVWQVSKSQYPGFADGWRTPPGLVASGEVSGTAREFSVNFGTVAATAESTAVAALPVPSPALPRPGLPGFPVTIAREIPKPQRAFYVRAVPVDGRGNPVGDPGPGVPVLYGEALPPARLQGVNLGVGFELWTARLQGQPTSMGEFPNKFEHYTLPRGYSPEYPGAYWFRPQGYESEATALVVQVSNKQFANTAAGWDVPPGLAYSYRYERPVEPLAHWPDAIPVTFRDFGPPKAALPADYYLTYFVRVVAVKPSSTPGCEDVTFSETVQVKYGWATPPHFYTPKTVVAKSYAPSLKIKQYQPIRNQDPNWAQYYEVYRAPAWNEINCKFRNVQTGVTLYPYAIELMKNPSLTPAQYEQTIIPQVLVKGTKVRIVPAEKDKSWWEELWDGITGFFEDLWSVVRDIGNWVANAYNGLRQGLIDWVASALPIPGLRTALEWMVNTGLMALGLPPTLPTFDQLTSLSLDYLAQVALTEAGLPADQITSALVAETAEAIGSEMAKAAAAPTPNPIDSPFLKADSAKLQQPAFIDIEVANDYTGKPTRPGSLNIDIEWEWRETGYALDHSVWGQLPVSQQYAEAATYTLHFVYGLKRGHSGYPVYYPVYEPIRGYPIPILQPGDRRTVRIYLTPYTGEPYPFAVLGDAVLGEDFANLYWGKCGQVRFSAQAVGFELGDPKQAAIEQGHVPDPENYMETYYWDHAGGGSTFMGLPNQARVLP